MNPPKEMPGTEPIELDLELESEGAGEAGPKPKKQEEKPVMPKANPDNPDEPVLQHNGKCVRNREEEYEFFQYQVQLRQHESQHLRSEEEELV
jgi:hypothetical protein